MLRAFHSPTANVDMPLMALGTMTAMRTAPLPGAKSAFIRLSDWVAESRAHRVICIVLGIWLLNGFDLALTILAHQQGLLHEENPLAREILRDGPSSIFLFKVGLVLVGSYPLLKFRTARITELGALVVLISYATLAMHWSTVYDLYCMMNTAGFTMADVDQIAGPWVRY